MTISPTVRLTFPQPSKTDFPTYGTASNATFDALMSTATLSDVVKCDRSLAGGVPVWMPVPPGTTVYATARSHERNSAHVYWIVLTGSSVASLYTQYVFPPAYDAQARELAFRSFLVDDTYEEVATHTIRLSHPSRPMNSPIDESLYDTKALQQALLENLGEHGLCVTSDESSVAFLKVGFVFAEMTCPPWPPAITMFRETKCMTGSKRHVSATSADEGAP